MGGKGKKIMSSKSAWATERIQGQHIQFSETLLKSNLKRGHTFKESGGEYMREFGGSKGKREMGKWCIYVYIWKAVWEYGSVGRVLNYHARNTGFST